MRLAPALGPLRQGHSTGLEVVGEVPAWSLGGGQGGSDSVTRVRVAQNIGR